MRHGDAREGKRSRSHARGLLSLAGLAAFAAQASCGFDRSDRYATDDVAVALCVEGALRCTDALERCERGARRGDETWRRVDDCTARGQVCAPELLACAPCQPGASRCEAGQVLRCAADGSAFHVAETCDATAGRVCRIGRCTHLCTLATIERSNVGCEYWAADLDNAMIDDSLNAAAQQFAVVVSNPQPDVAARVTIEIDDGPPRPQPREGIARTENAPITVATADIPPLNLRVFKLGPREVDGSPPGTYNRGTHTALSRKAYRVTSQVPVVAYQFNPLENVNVFSNDASLLKPVEALTYTPGEMSAAYVVLGWPQTIASSDDPNTNFNPADPIDLRAFLTIVATRPDTRVRVQTTTAIVGGGPIPATPAGGVVEAVLDPFDVLNLETGGFNADFTGSLIDADQPIVVFSGSEASDAPFFQKLQDRRCCADHLEEQLDPVRTAGKRFAITRGASRTEALVGAGATLGVIDEPDYFRIVAATDAGARITTTLSGALSQLELKRRGDFLDLTATRDFMLESDHPIMLGNVSPSQRAAGISRGLPGGDPSFLVVPPIEQFRASYVFLTPDKYSFDFLRIIAPPDTTIVFDGRPLEELGGCATAPADGLAPEQRKSEAPPLVVHRCQLSFPKVKTIGGSVVIEPGVQNDGVHRIDADRRIGVLVDGFDSFVSYAYAAGTELIEIAPPR